LGNIENTEKSICLHFCLHSITHSHKS